MSIEKDIRIYFEMKDAAAMLIASARPISHLLPVYDVMRDKEDAIREYYGLPARPSINVMVPSPDIDALRPTAHKSS